jgi:uncharacterized protein involved in exopolysaccharide biosynthesis
MTTSTMIILAVVGAGFAAAGAALAWVQLHTRQPSIARAESPRPRRRPF